MTNNILYLTSLKKVHSPIKMTNFTSNLLPHWKSHIVSIRFQKWPSAGTPPAELPTELPRASHCGRVPATVLCLRAIPSSHPQGATRPGKR